MARILGFTLSGIFVFFAFQNCGQMIAHQQQNLASSTQSGGDDVNLEGVDCEIADCSSIIKKASKTCFFNGVAVPEGEAVQSFQSPFGAQCKSQMRTCRENEFDGSFLYSLCNTDTQVATETQNCIFNGQVVESGKSVEAFLQSSVTGEQECQKQYRRCRNGVMTGTYRYSSCEKDVKKACLFNGITVADSNFIKAFKRSDEGACLEEFRVCQDGQLSGTYQDASCSDKIKTCQFNGQTLLEAEVVKAFTVYDENTRRCADEERVCENGNLTGSYSFPSCEGSDDEKSCQFAGEVIAHEEVVTAFKRVEGAPCEKAQRQCNNGVLDGDTSFNLKTCEPNQPKSCTAFEKVVPHGESVKSFLVESESTAGACEEGAVISRCENGAFDKPLQAFGICETKPEPQKDCRVNGEVLKGGRSVYYYGKDLINLDNTPEGCGGANFKRVICRDGAIFDDTDRLKKGELLGFDEVNLPGHTHKTCEVVGRDCNFRGKTYKTGDRTTFYKRDKVDYSLSWSCSVSGFDNAMNARCWNGDMTAWGGTDPIDLSAYPHNSCQVITEDCTYKGETVDHGRSLGDLFKLDKVPSTDFDRFGRDISCESNGNHVEIRCIDGQISNRKGRQVDGKTVYDPVNTNLYPHESCEVEAKSCMLEGVEVPHQRVFYRYKSQLIPYVPGNDLGCSQDGNRVRAMCLDGSLKYFDGLDDEGDPKLVDFNPSLYPYNTCKIDAKACTFDGQTFSHGSTINERIKIEEKRPDGNTVIRTHIGSSRLFKRQSVPFNLDSNLCFAEENAVEAVCTDGVITKDGLPVDLNVYKYSTCKEETVGCTVNGREQRHQATFYIFKQPRVYSDQGTSCFDQDYGYKVRCIDGKVYIDERPYVEINTANYPYNGCGYNTGTAPQ